MTMLFFKHLYLFTKKNVLQLQRKWLSLPLLILFPIIILGLIITIIISIIPSPDQEPIEVAFVDLDQSEETQLMMNIITESSQVGSFIDIIELTETEAIEKMNHNQLDMYVTFPDHFASNLYHGQPVNFAMVGNPNKKTEGYLIKELVDSVARHIRVAQANILTINYYAKQLPLNSEMRNDLLFSQFTDFLIYTIGKDIIIDKQTIKNQATASSLHYYALASWFIITILWSLIFYHILHQVESNRMKNRIKLYGVTQLQQILAKTIVTLFMTGILSGVSFAILQKLIGLELLNEDLARIFLTTLLLHIILLECLAIIEQMIQSQKTRLLMQSGFTLTIVILSGAIIPTLYFPMFMQELITYLFSYQAFHWLQEVVLQQRFFIDFIPLFGMSIVGLLVLVSVSLWKERIQ